jgi:dihydrofolate reductase
MPKVIADITMSLDGYVTGPGADPAHGLGDAPELHAWVSEQDQVDTEIFEGATAASGAVVMGRRLFDTVDGPTAGRRTWATARGIANETSAHWEKRSMVNYAGGSFRAIQPDQRSTVTTTTGPGGAASRYCV